MRSDLRHRLREIAVSLSFPKNGATGVTLEIEEPCHTASHRIVTPLRPGKAKQTQAVTPATPVTPPEMEDEIWRHTGGGVSGQVTGGVTAPGNDAENWFAHFEERAAIREYEGGFDRAEAERLALTETIAALGPQRSLLQRISEASGRRGEVVGASDPTLPGNRR